MEPNDRPRVSKSNVFEGILQEAFSMQEKILAQTKF